MLHGFTIVLNTLVLFETGEMHYPSIAVNKFLGKKRPVEKSKSKFFRSFCDVFVSLRHAVVP